MSAANVKPFHFYTQMHLPFLLGRRASTPTELLDCIKTVPASSIYYHTHRFLFEHHYLSPEPSNDFAYWVTKILGMARLGELLASIDIVYYESIEKLRSVFDSILSKEIGRLRKIPECQDGNEFHFMYCKTVVIPTAIKASDLNEFIDAVGRISNSALYFHFFQAALRIGQGDNDFARWLADIGEAALARELSRLDPYSMTLEELRQRIITIGKLKSAHRRYK